MVGIILVYMCISSILMYVIYICLIKWRIRRYFNNKRLKKINKYAIGFTLKGDITIDACNVVVNNDILYKNVKLRTHISNASKYVSIYSDSGNYIGGSNIKCINRYRDYMIDTSNIDAWEADNNINKYKKQLYEYTD